MVYDIKRKLHIETMADGGDFIWAVSSEIAEDIRILCKIYKSDLQTRFIGVFYGTGRITQIVTTGEALYLIPMGATSIAVYEIFRNTWKYIEIKIADSFNVNFAFSFAEIYGKWIYIFPLLCPVIVRLDVKTERVEYFWEELKKFQMLNIWDRPQALMEKVKRQGNAIIIYSPDCGFLFSMDLHTLEIKIMKNMRPQDLCRIVEYDGNNFWFIPTKKELLIRKWDGERETSYENGKCEINYGRIPFYLHTFFKKRIWLLPGLADSVLCIESDTNRIYKEENFSPAHIEQNQEIEQFKFSCLCNCGDVLYVFDQTDNTLVYTDGDCVKRCNICLDQETHTVLEIGILIQKISENNNTICDKLHSRLQTFVTYKHNE